MVYIYTRRGHPKRPDLWGSGVFLGCKIYDGGYTEITRFMYIQLAGDNVYNNGKSWRLFVRLYCYMVIILWCPAVIINYTTELPLLTLL